MSESELSGTVVCRLPESVSGGRIWARFSHPSGVLAAEVVDDVLPTLDAVADSVRRGRYAAGFITYEAATAFDEANSTHHPNEDYPLVWFGIYEQPAEIGGLEEILTSSAVLSCADTARTRLAGELTPEFTAAEYIGTVERVLEYIRTGDIYQANLTFRQKCSAVGGLPFKLFRELMETHPVPYGAFVDTPETRLLSISPELFLNKVGNVLTTIPMKGTAARSPIPSTDAEIAAGLSADEKNRAENLMIVDMARNDLGRICVPGSIKVENLFKVETYASLHQMVSVVNGELRQNLTFSDIFRAMFPAASITGAPKIRAMEVIRELEKSPRGVYTGTIGCVVPGGDFLFNVAIRTISASTTGCELSVGSGVVADSVPRDEWDECLLKSEFAKRRPPMFELLETMLWRRDSGSSNRSDLDNVAFLDEHLTRLKISADRFGFAVEIPTVRAEIAASLESSPETASFARLRLTLSRDGDILVESTPLESADWGTRPLKIAVSTDHVNSNEIFLRHKTTHREFYDERFRKALEEGFDEVLFINERDEVTEGAISNLFIRKGKKWKTPALECGLLSGVFRAKLIAELGAEESVIHLSELRSADELILCNSVRGAEKGRLV
ncbi:MAG: aminodeoxychorismate synthase component I [Kiritimatiellaeota bacterium]|nr:aminodeoxychorismate synthase component I [Kiritimatiellota bacterium]